MPNSKTRAGRVERDPKWLLLPGTSTATGRIAPEALGAYRRTLPSKDVVASRSSTAKSMPLIGRHSLRHAPPRPSRTSLVDPQTTAAQPGGEAAAVLGEHEGIRHCPATPRSASPASRSRGRTDRSGPAGQRRSTRPSARRDQCAVPAHRDGVDLANIAGPLRQADRALELAIRERPYSHSLVV